MAKITKQSENFSKWYTDTILHADLADYGPVKGTMVVKPYGFSLWSNVKKALNNMIEESGHENAYFPLFIPKSFFEKEAKHVEGFAKECAVVTHSKLVAKNDGLEVDPKSKLEEEIIVRPTSETIIWSMFKKWITSYRDLPVMINQWANVVRWEMRTRLFLRTSEFLWQEGHTAHATKKEAMEETLKIVEIYKSLFEDHLAIPTLIGKKSDSEKFAGAEETFSIETMMRDKKALQAGTSHYLGTNFGNAFDVKFQSKDNKEQPVYATSWGVSTRVIGALIMVHGDDKGLKIPPKVAPHQAVIIPINPKNENEKEFNNFVNKVTADLDKNNIRCKVDNSENTPGFKFNFWELRGAPIRIEIGLQEHKDKKLTICRRDTGEKISIKHDDINAIEEMLHNIQESMYNSAAKFLKENTVELDSYKDLQKKLSKDNCFIKAYWDGSEESEMKVKEDTKATIRCILEDIDDKKAKCIVSNKPAKHLVVFAKAY
ncbi:MAG: proline--tRNA ligase [Candidatus Neomarinimicrobiota bacterium]|nr:proline--tRNA ligase [Candidatus Neomarinimicrobiota bacterium]